jgi:DNA-directed RNA polymerase specialized sigma24 family protein
MERLTTQKKNWTLTRGRLDAFLARLHEDREQAGREYEQIRRRLLTFFRCNGCSNAEDPVDETIDRVIQRLEEVKVVNLMAFVCGVARRVVSEVHRKAREIPLADIRELSSWDALGESDAQARERGLDCLQKGLLALKPADRELLKSWYLYDKAQKIENRKHVAELRGVSATALRLQAFRARQRLQELVEDCLKALPG